MNIVIDGTNVPIELLESQKFVFLEHCVIFMREIKKLVRKFLACIKQKLENRSEVNVILGFDSRSVRKKANCEARGKSFTASAKRNSNTFKKPSGL